MGIPWLPARLTGETVTVQLNLASIHDEPGIQTYQRYRSLQKVLVAIPENRSKNEASV